MWDPIEEVDHIFVSAISGEIHVKEGMNIAGGGGIESKKRTPEKVKNLGK